MQSPRFEEEYIAEKSVEPVLSGYESFPAEIAEMIDGNASQHAFFDVAKHSFLIPDIYDLPDMRYLMHTSRLLKLEDYIKDHHDIQKKEINSAESGVYASSKFKIAVVIDDMGASPQRTKQISEIKAPLTASFVTFANRLAQQVEYSKQSGQEIMIHVPMEPKAQVFVSDDVLTVDMSEAEIEKAFVAMLHKFKDVKGINNHMGSKFTEYSDKLAPVMKILAQNHLFFLDSKTTSSSVAEGVARRYNVPYVERHIFLDNENNLEYILRQFEKAENKARRNGFAIAIGHPKTQTILALHVWLKTLKNKNIELVPLSDVVALANLSQ